RRAQRDGNTAGTGTEDDQVALFHALRTFHVCEPMRKLRDGTAIVYFAGTEDPAAIGTYSALGCVASW
ncbi:MAG TPA: hypothetical protein VH375_01240, partial [Rhodanobacteraceae bacterium]